MADIFISYKREDITKAQLLAKKLEGEGWSVWWDSKIGAGDSFRRQIQEELKSAHCIIVIWSKLSVDSLFIIDEAKEGMDRKILIPVSFDNSIPPLGFRELQVLYFDQTNKQFEAQYAELKQYINNKIELPMQEMTFSQPMPDKKNSKYYFIGGTLMVVVIISVLFLNNTNKDFGNSNATIQDMNIAKQKNPATHNSELSLASPVDSNSGNTHNEELAIDAPCVVGVGNDYFYFFDTRGDGHIYYSTGELGGGGSEWKQVNGSISPGSGPAAGAIGNQVFVGVRGQDNNIYLNQATLNGQFNDEWQSMNFQTDAAPALLGVQNYIYIFAKNLDGKIYYNRAALSQSFEGWKEVEGNGVAATGSSPAAGAIGDYIYLVIRGVNNNLYLNQGTAGSVFLNSWQQMGFTTNASPAVTGVGNYIYFFALNADNKAYYEYAQFKGGGNGWKKIDGDNPAASSIAAGAVRNSYIFITIKDKSGNSYLNQGDVLKNFQSSWQPIR